MNLWKWLKSKFVRPVVKAFGGFIKYQENDPTTPNLAILKNIPSLPNPCPPFAVLEFTGADGEEGTPQHQAANVYCTIVFSLAYVQSKLEKPIVRWAALCKLLANPRSGKMFNAYYDRYYLNFFYEVDPKNGFLVYTCDSADVVAHELGHAILDAIRPDLWAVQCVEIQAFHEAFGDINAILTALTMPEIVKSALDETGGDLAKDNVISRLAEQMAIAIIHAKGQPDPSGAVGLRNAINTLKYVPPETLPTQVPNDGLAGEPHSFSRVFVGGWYDAFAKIYSFEKTLRSPEEAVAVARDKMAKITYNAIRFAKVNARFFTSTLGSMLLYDAQHNLGCGQFIREGFAQHDLFADSSNMSLVEQDIKPRMMSLFANNGVETARVSDFYKESDNPLFDCIVELADRHQAGVYMSEMVGLQEAINAARHSLKVLHERNRVGQGPTVGKIHEKEFTVIDGRLVRNFFCCHFHKNKL